MNEICAGKNCRAKEGRNHSIECLFEHFMAYTGGHKESIAIQTMLEKAYFDGYEAGKNEK